MYAKGGMDDEEFGKYVKNTLVPLFPDSGDVPGKRVIIKVNSGPVTQDMDLTSARLNCNMSPSIQPFLIGLLVFGGIDPISHETLPKKCISRGIQ